jgi:hypothetical protein
VSFVAVTLLVASRRVIPKVSVYYVIDSVRKLLDTTSHATDVSSLKVYSHMKCTNVYSYVTVTKICVRT